MKQRVITGFGLVAFLLLIFFSKSVTTYVFDAFVIMLAMYGGYEMSELLKKIGMYNNKWCIMLYPILSYILYKICFIQELTIYLTIVLQIALLIAISAGISVFCIVTKKRTDNEIKTRKLKCSNEQFAIYKGIQSLFGMVYPGFIVMLMIFINNLQNISETFTKFGLYGYEISLFLLVFVFVTPIFVDTFAMLTGLLFKGPKLCPKVSPNKTVSGAIGGFIWGTAAAVLLFFIFNSIDVYRLIFINLNFTWWKVLIAGAFASIFCQIGDIFESYLKRKANVKDSGDLLPGHGGILDRIDSHIVNIIVVFIFMLVV